MSDAKATARPAARLSRNVALVECADAATLGEVAAGPLGRYIVRRLSDTVVVVDHARVEQILGALRKGGYNPRVSNQGEAWR
jgi:hypothetical protein